MDATLKAKWVGALRSGKYKQGQGRLRSVNDEYCCLGVLCDVSGVGEWQQKGTDWRYKVDDGTAWAGDLVFLPAGVADDLRTTMISPDCSLHSKLIEMNDTGRADFQQIADFIEQKL